MIEDVIDTFRNNTPAVKRNMVRKRQIEKYMSQSFVLQSLMSIRFFSGYSISAAQFLSLHRSKKVNK